MHQKTSIEMKPHSKHKTQTEETPPIRHCPPASEIGWNEIEQGWLRVVVQDHNDDSYNECGDIADPCAHKPASSTGAT
jgi:hypothetical protein